MKPVTTKDLENANQVTQNFRDRLEIPNPSKVVNTFSNFDEMFEIVLQEQPAIFSFVFGVLDKKYLNECRKKNIITAGTATTLQEAELLAESGIDVIVAQGAEAGGHRGIFKVEIDDPDISQINLTKQIASKIKQPIISAGGIMNGSDVKSALAAGAAAVQMGSAFLLAAEAGTSKAYRQALKTCTNRPTKLTRAFSGRLARGIENEFMQAFPGNTQPLPWPAQNFYTRDIRNKAAEKNNFEFLSLWAGIGFQKIEELPAAEILLKTAKEAGF
jgi:nitronate monooxygenase